VSDSTKTTRLGAAFLFSSERTLTANTVTSYRAAASHETTADRLGPGFGEGTGFNLIARPSAGWSAVGGDRNERLRDPGAPGRAAGMIADSAGEAADA